MRSVNGLCSDLPFKQLARKPSGDSFGMQTGANIQFQLPNLLLHCPFELRISPYCKQVSVASGKWLEGFAVEQRWMAVKGLRPGLLASMCYPTVDYGQLRVCCDFISWLFHLRDGVRGADFHAANYRMDQILDWLRSPGSLQDDNLDTRLLSNLAGSFWARLCKNTSPSLQSRLLDAMQVYFSAVHRRAADERNRVHPDLESYMTLRRSTSGCELCFLLIEYGHGMELPEIVRGDSIITSLEQAANDVVAWSNDIYSYNADQSRGNVHNLVAVVMRDRGIDLQAAMNFVGDLCVSRIRNFVDEARCVNSWDHNVDGDVAAYIRGLQDWMIGSLHWSFESERYFGSTGDRVKVHRMVTLSASV